MNGNEDQFLKKLNTHFASLLSSKLLSLVLMLTCTTLSLEFLNGILIYVIPCILLSLLVFYQLIQKRSEEVLKSQAHEKKQNSFYNLTVLKWWFYTVGFAVTMLSYLATGNFLFVVIAIILLGLFCFNYPRTFNNSF